MRSQQLVAVVIPVYKTQPSKDETASFLQAISILRQHPVIIFTYLELDLSAYYALAGNTPMEIVYFDQQYFADIEGYNRLLCDRIFYQRFLSYKFVLIYQLDAWVFRDELDQWCAADYDYIGAPWFGYSGDAPSAEQFLGIGNGGFSLRKISSHLKALKRWYYLVPIHQLWSTFRKQRLGRFAFKLLVKTVVYKNISHDSIRPAQDLMNEDVFWSLLAKRNFNWFRTPDMLTAARFSFELCPAQLFGINGCKLPFGCHAWKRYDFPFWKSYIKTI